MTEDVLVTGGFGLVGSQTVRQLVADGHRVVASDLGTSAQRKAARSLPAGAAPYWADLTDPAEVDRLVAKTAPATIIHLAAMIPPGIYRHPKLARRVNVDATAALLRAAKACPRPVRFIQASSNAVHGSRNPRRHREWLRADTPVRPADLYGAHKVEAEQLVRASGLDWVILRLAGVMSVDLGAMPLSMDAPFLESALPTDGRIHTVDVRDVAVAFSNATTADVIGETLLIGGDESHLLRQSDVGKTLAASRGLVNVLPAGRPGDPDSEDDWYVTDWMDTARAQQALRFQRHPWPDMLAEMRAAAGWQRYPMRLVSPIARQFLKRRDAYRNSSGDYADPWGAIRAEFGEPRPDGN
ncbi:NAD-dependent epimerase/dehydratase family protein [Mycobacterium montefiorense]|uniref:Oxidoreductase n=1 Tax=Mycobacterium montefiorense TaxID=154654 RepID=A0AA37PSW0_9MYCO|nr:NAD(P)-dependent oxidoreductase [Mycobacterium montefiorense]GBG36280.1 oxidoreductase [Mycobacterium montefiorense]GKU32951.1 oxidoreductase [Mycobacterium montefiorense]GKU38579.1 oxidoreductase [Mycobacterium montefiorense]GKU46654.1 oxidoreductase [Mycobacterium montefiorense]GKU51573.1 oxidoreductase [Mycobacterium montefiorense]